MCVCILIRSLDGVIVAAIIFHIVWFICRMINQSGLLKATSHPFNRLRSLNYSIQVAQNQISLSNHGPISASSHVSRSPQCCRWNETSNLIKAQMIPFFSRQQVVPLPKSDISLLLLSLWSFGTFPKIKIHFFEKRERRPIYTMYFTHSLRYAQPREPVPVFRGSDKY